MKKIFGISLVAVLAATPLMANADPIVTPGTMGTQPANHEAAATAGVIAAGQPYFSLIEANSLTDGNAASAGYVKGAYNAAIKAVNTVHEEAAAKVDKTAIATSLSSASTDNQVASAKAVYDAIDAVDTGVMSVTEGSANGTIAVDGTDVSVHGLGSAAYTASTAYATAAQGQKADSAVQTVAEGSANGTIAVDGTDVSVHGLGSAAYTASTAYATAAQGQKADSALQSTDIATTLSNSSTDAQVASAKAVYDATKNSATTEGVTHTISNSTIAVTDGKTVSTTLSGKDGVTASTTVTVPIMTDWSNPNTVSVTPLEANASTTVNASSLSVSSTLGGSITAKITGGTYTATAPANN